MQIIMTRDHRHPVSPLTTLIFNRGQQVDVPDEIASQLIADGIAVAVAHAVPPTLTAEQTRVLQVAADAIISQTDSEPSSHVPPADAAAPARKGRR